MDGDTNRRTGGPGAGRGEINAWILLYTLAHNNAETRLDGISGRRGASRSEGKPVIP
jgi:hypothetical protein